MYAAVEAVIVNSFDTGTSVTEFETETGYPPSTGLTFRSQALSNVAPNVHMCA